jgi:D-threo-aldose 1-dehydrogenase
VTMRQVPLGKTGLRVSEIVFGSAPIGGLFAPVSDDDAAGALAAAWAAGIRAFDTAPHYGVGLSEQRIGRFLAGRPRGEFVLSTNVGRRLVPAPGDVEGVEGFYGTPRLARVWDYSRDGVLATLADSLTPWRPAGCPSGDSAVLRSDLVHQVGRRPFQRRRLAGR